MIGVAADAGVGGAAVEQGKPVAEDRRAVVTDPLPERYCVADLGAILVAALTARDFGRLARALAPDVRMRALTPRGPVEVAGAEAAAAKFASWFGEANGLELVHSGSDEVGDRLHVFYRLRVKRPGDVLWKVIEQHLLCALGDGCITVLDLVCSGFRPEGERVRC